MFHVKHFGAWLGVSFGLVKYAKPQRASLAVSGRGFGGHLFRPTDCFCAKRQGDRTGMWRVAMEGSGGMTKRQGSHV